MSFSEQLDKFVERGAEKYEIEFHNRYPEGMTVANYCNSDVPWNCFDAGAASLKPIVLKLQQEMYSAYNYLKGFDCDKHCDPSVDFHDPLCCIEQSFSKALAEVEQMIGGGK